MPLEARGFGYSNSETAVEATQVGGTASSSAS
jgi:hypothetical protein